jgi:7-keto-8-aminopelargonate synthetase-like enzyme
VLDDAHLVLDRSAPDPAALAGTEVLRVGTLSKALGSLGGFVAGSRAACDLLVNRARSYIFTTASTPADTAAALANLRVLRSPEGRARKDRLAALVDAVRPGHPSPVVPVLIGAEEAAVAAAGLLLERGVLVPAIRPPTVPPGTSRLRVALSAAHTDEQVERLARALATLPGDPGQFALRDPTR